MQLRHEQRVDFSASQRTWRQSPFMSVLRTIILGIVFAGAGPLWYYLEAPWFVVAACVGCAMLVVPLFIYNAAATLRKTNWLMRSDGRRLWLNIRSYSHATFADAANVIEFGTDEIESINREQTTFVGPMDVEPGAVTARRSHVLTIRFRAPVPAEIVEAIQAERERINSHRYFGIVTVTSRSHDDPVSLTDDQTLTVLWRSQHSMISPSLASAIDFLALQGVPVGDAKSRDLLWSSLSAEEQDDMIAELHNRGQLIEAKRLTRLRDSDRHDDDSTDEPSATSLEEVSC